ncbi:hypothetical protein [Comamonas sp. AG1104]|uniref:hypothetical protein n=1 Tax=Comamonas sp. AG1104 TaxID=2183900 RepID=UPI000E09FEF9|nr:hypothetical protein [Comamonas sp. AG1104]RDI10589.1 hypothetical protein DFO48_10599 [Comamonas sp. AG1104]
MDIFQLVIPLLGVLLGGVISGSGNLLKARADRKRTVASALANLLEVRHHIVGVGIVLTEIKKRAPCSAQDLQLIEAQFHNFFPLDEEVHNRYKKAIDTLEGIDPVLAFQMRSKNEIQKYLGQLDKLPLENGIDHATFSQMRSFLKEAIIPSLDRSVIKLAGAHSCTTKNAVKKLIAQEDEKRSEIGKLFDNMQAMSLPNLSSST